MIYEKSFIYAESEEGFYEIGSLGGIAERLNIPESIEYIHYKLGKEGIFKFKEWTIKKGDK